MRSVSSLVLVCQDAGVPRPSKISPLNLQGINIYIKHPALLDGLVCGLSFVKVPNLSLTLVLEWLERWPASLLACLRFHSYFSILIGHGPPISYLELIEFALPLYKTTVPYRGLKQDI